MAASEASNIAEHDAIRWLASEKGNFDAKTTEGLVQLKAAIVDSESHGDFVSRELFKSILESEEEHIDFLETQLDLIKRIGIENYCQSQLGEGEE